ncbi:MarR family transcriptional regulator [Streptomyces sp. DW4-2]|uniref:MarR family transcriptional regulator n=1 Tax=Streptomyces spirodelae TaxID=2812904 RepID=A0ABS3WZJ8_9ACTN|nr:MarR family transcriptional regulator [Streptomyces spirodelae]
MVALAAGEPVTPLEDALSRLQCVLVARRSHDNPEQVTWQQWDALETLRIHGPMKPSLLSDSLGASRQTMSKILRVLKGLGLVEQTTDEGDRREHTTALTDRGREFLARTARGRRRNADVAADALSPGEQALFAELCQKVSGALEATLRGH